MRFYISSQREVLPHMQRTHICIAHGSQLSVVRQHSPSGTRGGSARSTTLSRRRHSRHRAQSSPSPGHTQIYHTQELLHAHHTSRVQPLLSCDTTLHTQTALTTPSTHLYPVCCARREAMPPHPRTKLVSSARAQCLLQCAHIPGTTPTQLLPPPVPRALTKNVACAHRPRRDARPWRRRAVSAHTYQVGHHRHRRLPKKGACACPREIWLLSRIPCATCDPSPRAR